MWWAVTDTVMITSIHLGNRPGIRPPKALQRARRFPPPPHCQRPLPYGRGTDCGRGTDQLPRRGAHGSALSRCTSGSWRGVYLRRPFDDNPVRHTGGSGNDSGGWVACFHPGVRREVSMRHVAHAYPGCAREGTPPSRARCRNPVYWGGAWPQPYPQPDLTRRRASGRPPHRTGKLKSRMTCSARSAATTSGR